MLQVVTDFYLNLQLTSLQIIVVSKFFWMFALVFVLDVQYIYLKVTKILHLKVFSPFLFIEGLI